MFRRISLITVVAMLSALLPLSQAHAGGDYIYTKNFMDEVNRQDFDGTGSVISLGQFGAGANINIFGDYLYMSYNGIVRMKLDGTQLTTLSTTSDIFSLASDGTYFYYGFETTQKIGRMKVDGTQVDDNWADLSSIPFLYAGDIFIANGNLYFGGGNNSNGFRIAYLPLSGGTPTLLATSQSPISGLTTDGTYIYWSEFWGDGLGRVRFDGTGLQNDFVIALGSDVWTLEYSNGYIYALARNYIVRITVDGQSVDRTWRLSQGDRGMAIGGVRTNPIQFNLVGNLYKGVSSTLYASFPYPGKVTFYAGGKRIPQCINLSTLASSPYSVTCNYKPSIRGSAILSVKLQPTDTQKAAINSSTSYVVASRTTRR